MQLNTALDWFIHGSLRENETHQLQARVLSGVLLFDLLLVLFGQIPLYLARSLPAGTLSRGHLILGLLAGLVLTLLLILKYRGALLLVSNLFVAVLIATIIAAWSISANPSSSLTTMLLVVPPLIFLTAGARNGLLWTLVAALTHLILTLTPLWQTQRILSDLVLNGLYLTFIYTAVGSTCLIYERITRRVHQTLQKERDALDFEANHDPLTRLHNRASFERSLRSAMQQAVNDRQLVALVYIDLDQFKPINDTHGHATGDSVLKTIAQRLSDSVRSSDICARLGGDEFGVILRGLPEAEAAKISAEKIYRALCRPIPMPGIELDPGASIGVALCPEHSTDPDTLWHYADIAMYAAKAGGSHVRLFQPDLDLEP